MTATVAQSLARHATEWQADVATPQRAAATDNAVVDWFGVTLAGSGAGAARALATGLSSTPEGSRLIGSGQRAPVTVAALVNGTAAHVLELDDIYAPGLFHPGAPIVAAAFAVADERGDSVPKWKSAVTTGYEVGCRVARDLGPAHYAHWHTTGTAGTVGAAAAVAVLLGLSAEPFAHALSLAATMSAGLQQTFRSDAMGKPLHSGNAAHAGAVAAIAAANGVTGASDVFEGTAGLAAATGAATSWEHSRLPFEGPAAIEQITVKPFPCCGHTFAPIAAALRLRQDGIDPAGIATIEVATYSAAIAVAGIAAPRSPQERRFSIPFTVARALTDGAVHESGFASSDPALDELCAEVVLTVDDRFEQAFPDRRGARVVVTTTSGQRHEVGVPDRPGSPQNPLTAADIDAKFLAAVAPVLGERSREALDRLRGNATAVGDLVVV
ncbi:MmgE/PrpD family protein [Nocardia sp. NBC_00881]|uniref:MmgE/PrpD family protein n=1 Tax=Nocardia sp. NBC_00881 TaxID=2975995 RepID=UPI003864CAF8|nr:MmgE/PrpD family protein [Nocardia sp. NBC_00881]